MSRVLAVDIETDEEDVELRLGNTKGGKLIANVQQVSLQPSLSIFT